MKERDPVTRKEPREKLWAVLPQCILMRAVYPPLRAAPYDLGGSHEVPPLKGPMAPHIVALGTVLPMHAPLGNRLQSPTKPQLMYLSDYYQCCKW